MSHRQSLGKSITTEDIRYWFRNQPSAPCLSRSGLLWRRHDHRAGFTIQVEEPETDPPNHLSVEVCLDGDDYDLRVPLSDLHVDRFTAESCLRRQNGHLRQWISCEVSEHGTLFIRAHASKSACVERIQALLETADRLNLELSRQPQSPAQHP